jgi:hypothetical protein
LPLRFVCFIDPAVIAACWKQVLPCTYITIDVRPVRGAIFLSNRADCDLISLQSAAFPDASGVAQRAIAPARASRRAWKKRSMLRMIAKSSCWMCIGFSDSSGPHECP